MLCVCIVLGDLKNRDRSHTIIHSPKSPRVCGEHRQLHVQTSFVLCTNVMFRRVQGPFSLDFPTRPLRHPVPDTTGVDVFVKTLCVSWVLTNLNLFLVTCNTVHDTNSIEISNLRNYYIPINFFERIINTLVF